MSAGAPTFPYISDLPLYSQPLPTEGSCTYFQLFLFPYASSSIPMLTSPKWADPPSHLIHHHIAQTPEQERGRAPASLHSIPFSEHMQTLSLEQLSKPTPHLYPQVPFNLAVHPSTLWDSQITVLSMLRLGYMSIYMLFFPGLSFPHHRITSFPAKL